MNILNAYLALLSKASTITNAEVGKELLFRVVSRYNLTRIYILMGFLSMFSNIIVVSEKFTLYFRSNGNILLA